MSMKSSNHIIGNRTRDLQAGSAVPQPTAPLRAHHNIIEQCITLVSENAVHSTTHTNCG